MAGESSTGRPCLMDEVQDYFSLSGIHHDVSLCLALMRLYAMQAGSLVSQINQRTLVTKTFPERMWPAKDAAGILVGRTDSQLNSSAPASSPLWLSINLSWRRQASYQEAQAL